MEYKLKPNPSFCGTMLISTDYNFNLLLEKQRRKRAQYWPWGSRIATSLHNDWMKWIPQWFRSDDSSLHILETSQQRPVKMDHCWVLSFVCGRWSVCPQKPLCAITAMIHKRTQSPASQHLDEWLFALGCLVCLHDTAQVSVWPLKW